MKKAIIDIDGVLNYYPYIQIKFMNEKLGTNFKTLSEIKNTLPYLDYRKLKQEYRMSEYKHDADVACGAVELIKYLKAKGYLIYIVTSRQLFANNMLENTLLWLKKRGIEYDYVYCTIKKDFTIFEKFGHIDLVVEDNVNNIENIKKVNGDGLYFNVVNCENMNKETTCTRVSSLFDIIQHMEKEALNDNNN